MADLPNFDRRMSDAEGLMWRLDKDPHLGSTFANITLLDRSPDLDVLRRRLERATYVVRRLRQRVQPGPVGIGAPVWVDDPDFDLRYHVRHIALPKPGSMRQLLDLTALLVNDAFDRTRPLWQFVVIDGLRGGRSAVLQKLHHTIVDGEGGVQLSLQFLDLEREAPEPPPLDPDLIARAEQAAHEPHQADTLRDVLAGSFRMPLGLAKQVRELLADPTGIPAAGSAAADTVRGIVQQLGDLEAARSPLWVRRSLGRRIEVLQAPFGACRQAAKRLGGTLNTAFLTAAADAAGRYHRELGSPVEHLRSSMVVSTRTETSGANAFSLARLLVPTGEMSVADRFRDIQQRTSEAKGGSTVSGMEAITALTTALPTAVVTRLARQQAQTVDFATSNVRGAPVPLYLAGAQLLANHPVGPLMGVAFNLTLLSYNHSLDMGINIDTAAVAEPDRLVRCLQRAFDDLQDV